MFGKALVNRINNLRHLCMYVVFGSFQEVMYSSFLFLNIYAWISIIAYSLCPILHVNVPYMFLYRYTWALF